MGTEKFSKDYTQTENITEADGILVRSAAMHDMDLPENLLAVARAGAGVNNIPLINALRKELSYSIRPALMRTVLKSSSLPACSLRPEMSLAV